MKPTDRNMLDDILKNGIDVPLFTRLVRAQAEIMRRFHEHEANHLTVAMWEHLTERYGQYEGFLRNNNDHPSTFIDPELDRLVAMGLLRTEDGARYYWVPLEVEGVVNENVGS